MNKLYVKNISQSLSLKEWQVEHCIELLEQGSTIPFISRYRKERTGNLDESQIAEIKYNYQKFNTLEERKQTILQTIDLQGALTPDLKTQITNTLDAQELEDLYLPYKPKRRTRATIAKEKGLQPLAEAIYSGSAMNPYQLAQGYLNNDVETVQEAISGAKDIIAEKISEISSIRVALRTQILKYGSLNSKIARGKDPESEEAQLYKNYFKYQEPIYKVAAHRTLAVLRGESSGVLSVGIDADDQRYIDNIYYENFRNLAKSRDLVTIFKGCSEDAYKRLIFPSIQKEVLNTIKEKADIQSIRLFGENLRQLLMAPPLGGRRVLAIDPGFRTGCKVVCLDSQGALLHNDTIYPHPPANERTMAMKKISNMIEVYNIEIVAIGNGTAGRETEAFIKRMALPAGLKVYSVSEDGASVYSASAIARKEFPDYDVTVRGAVSIGRRIMDPLAELVKIDPKSIGVGQYQHDVDQVLLKQNLDNVVESCVNTVGVNLNTASAYLLSYVSGIGPTLAENIIEYRNENGPFKRRKDLLKVKRLGEKVFEQCAGFLRIPDSTNPLDNTAVHPESYSIVEQMAKDKNVKVDMLISDSQLRSAINLSDYTSGDVGMVTLEDIIQELSKPGRDPRSQIKVFEFSDEIRTIEDLQVSMELGGIINNITNFGAFVDLGIKQKGLIHISQLSDEFVSDPMTVVKINQHVKVKVIDLDIKRQRIGLKLISN